MKKLLTILISAAVCIIQPCLGLESMGKVQLNATPDKGCVFAGWYDENGKPIKGGADYRTASYTCAATEGVAKMTARFATVEDDMASLAVNVEDKATTADGMFALDLGACVESLSLPKISVSGLPSGIKYDSKTLKISGKATKPGVYVVKVSAANTSVKKAIVKEFRITVPNLSCAALPNLMPETDAYGTVMAGVAFDADRVNCSSKEGWTVKVSGLPSGLKYDAKTGKITGVPTAKAGSYTVTFTASKKGEANQVATITLNVEALPDWVVGTFYGKNVARGLNGTWTCPMQFTVTVSANGKISMKFTGPGEGTASRTAQLTKCREDGSFSFSFHYVSGRKGKEGYDEGDCEGVISPVVYGEDGALLGCLTTHDIGICDEDDDPCESKGVVYQSRYSRKPAVSGLPVFGKDNIRVVPVKSDCSDGEVTLKFGTKGAVAATWSGTKPAATCSSYISPYARDADGTVHAKLWLTFLDKTRTGFHGHPVQTGFDFDLEIPSAVPAAASDIKVASVRIESILVDFAHGGPYEIDVGDLPEPAGEHDMVQLWEGGPYWATTNIGAEKPWDYGYYFWWGDTVGYTRSGGTWTDRGDGSGYYSDVTWVSSMGRQMSSSPFLESSCPTYKDNSALQSAGWIDSTGNLVAAHDAAHVHWGGNWRMPTAAEISALINNCTTTWITTNGVSGRLVTGKGAYANRSIFLPAAGDGYDSDFYDPGSYGAYWSSTPYSSGSAWARCLWFNSGNFYRGSDYARYGGQSVRPVRGFAE